MLPEINDLIGGGERVRTDDLLRARQALSQLSYTPIISYVVGLVGIEPTTSRLSGVRSSHLSYRPEPKLSLQSVKERCINLSKLNSGRFRFTTWVNIHLRKEVIQPQVLLRLPCYDFTPITNNTVGACLPKG